MSTTASRGSGLLSTLSFLLVLLLPLLHSATALPPARRGERLSSPSSHSIEARAPFRVTLTSVEARAVVDGKLRTRQDGSSTTLQPKIDQDFPDPALLHAGDGKWYSFATSGNGKHIQAAVANTPSGTWTLLDQEVLPGPGWTTGANYWAPDVRQLGDGTYIMYFAGEHPEGGHCIGVATAKKPTGPYTIKGSAPLICPSSEGGAIDPAGFVDPATGYRYIVYKVDGNSLNSNAPTPLRLQRVNKEDGVTLIGDPVTILNRDSSDGPLVEAPDLVATGDGHYVLFFSSHMYTDSAYDVKYAVADSVTGPYTRGAKPLLQTPDMGLDGPGGATSSNEGNVLTFHSWCRDGVRCMYVINYSLTS